MDIADMQRAAHDNAIEKGFYEGDLADRNVGELLMLITTEVAEAMEAYRKHGTAPWSTYETTGYVGEATIEDFEAAGIPAKPEGVASELADVVIRVGDMCGYLGIDLDAAIAEKLAFNATRSWRHGGKLA